MTLDRGRGPLRLLAALALLVPCPRPATAQQAPGMDPALHAMQWGRTAYALSEVLEFAPRGAGQPVLYDLVAWYGGSARRVWAKADGGIATQGGGVHGEYQLLYGRLASPFFDLQLGARADVAGGAGRTESRVGAVVGMQGVAPGWFEVEPSLFVSTEGKVGLDFTASYDLYLSQRLVLQPRLEAAASLQDDLDFGIGRGLSSASFALRARYELRREVAPYLGVMWDGRFGRTADLARSAGEPLRDLVLVAGLRLWR